MKYVFVCLSFLTVNFLIAQEKTEKDSIKTTELKEVVLQSKKKSVEQKADRTIFDFSEQSHLNSGSVMEGLKKLPGLIVSDVAGMMYQGKFWAHFSSNLKHPLENHLEKHNAI